VASSDRIVSGADELRRRLPRLARPLVFTNGCFDLLHRGHVAYLEEARSLGESLLVAVNGDDSARRLCKGEGRPVNGVDDRMAVIAALACVDCVVPFDEDTPESLIRLVRPDHLVKGGDWPVERIAGADFVNGYGGTVHSIPFRFQRSTSALIARIRALPH
jgi:rfaE bifunctional protein nucleotidyltransferase chain/domain